MREAKLQEIKNMITIFKNMVDEDYAISIWDRNGVNLYFSKAETFTLHFDKGYKLEDKNDPLYRAMDEKKTRHCTVPKEVFGISLVGNLVPVFDEGEVVGCIACVRSLEQIEALRNSNTQMVDIIKDSDNSITYILDKCENTVNELKDVNNFLNTLEENIKGVYNVVESIKGNNSRTKMLALNASIEAARAGEDGKGFKIVANEMGKLSQMSAESVSNINVTLEKMTESIKNVTESISRINDSSLNSLESVEKLAENLSKMSVSLDK